VISGGCDSFGFARFERSTMAWTEITRRKYRRDGLRYASHLADAEWALIEPLLRPASPLGRPHETDLRSVVNAILYMASIGCQWRQLPKEFPPYSTVQSYFYAAWRNRLPDAVWGLMVFIAVGASLLFGVGRTRVPSLIFTVLPLAIAVGLLLIAEIDSPRSGIVRVLPENLVLVTDSFSANSK